MPILDDALAWFIGRTVSRSDVGGHVVYLFGARCRISSQILQNVLYLSDLDFDVDDDDPGHETAHRLFDRERGDAARRFGVVRFTLDVP